MSTHMTLMSFDHKFTHGVFNALDHEHLNLTLLTASAQIWLYWLQVHIFDFIDCKCTYLTLLTASAHIWHCYFCVKCLNIRLKRGIWSTDLDVVQELCESWGGRPGLSILTSLLVSVDIKLYWTMLQHWSQLVRNMSTDIWGHYLPTYRSGSCLSWPRGHVFDTAKYLFDHRLKTKGFVSGQLTLSSFEHKCTFLTLQCKVFWLQVKRGCTYLAHSL